MNEQAARFRIGIFVLAALIALGVLIILFGGRPYFFLPQKTYTVQFDNAPGIAPGTPVKRSGVKIGEVRNVTLDDDTGKVEVLIQIETGFKLRKGDRPTIRQSVLGGDSSIDFVPPARKEDMDTTAVEAGAVLEGFTQADAGTLLAKTSDVIHPAEEALKEMKKAFERLTPAAESTLGRIDKLAPVIEKAVNELTPEARAALREIRIAVPRTSDTIQDTAKKLTPSVEKMVEKIDKMVPVMERAFEKIDKLAPVVERAFDKIDKMAPNVEKGIDDFRKLVPDLRRSNDEIQVLARTWNKVGERLDLFIRTNEDKLSKTLERTDEMLKRVNEMFSDENQKNIQGIIKNVRVASDRFDSLAKNADDMIKDGRATLKTFDGSLQKIDQMVTDLQKVTKPLAERSESITRNIDEASDKLNRTLTDLRELLKTLNRSDGSFQKLMSDPALYNNLNEASLSLLRIMPRMDHIMRDVEIFADKIARHPESLGIGGVVRPGNGVKEAPAAYKVPGHP